MPLVIDVPYTKFILVLLITLKTKSEFHFSVFNNTRNISLNYYEGNVLQTTIFPTCILNFLCPFYPFPITEYFDKCLSLSCLRCLPLFVPLHVPRLNLLLALVILLLLLLLLLSLLLPLLFLVIIVIVVAVVRA